jgi:hypothetical protein
VYSHGNRVADPQLLDNAIHALQRLHRGQTQVQAFPGRTGPASSTVLDQEMGLLIVHRERILDACALDPD